VSFDLRDAELGISLGTFETEAEALAEVRRLVEQSHGSRAPLGLILDGRTVVATGDALVDLATVRSRLSRG
jgi:hypothetical protein